MTERTPVLSGDPSRPGDRVRQFRLVERAQKVRVGSQRPVRRAGHRVVPDAKLTIDGIAQDELEDVNRLHRRARSVHVPFEQLVRSCKITAGVDEKPPQPWTPDESGTHRLERRHTR